MDGIKVVKIDRWNGGSLRRYHFANGVILVCNSNRTTAAIPAFCHHIAIPVDREIAAMRLVSARRA